MKQPQENTRDMPEEREELDAENERENIKTSNSVKKT